MIGKPFFARLLRLSCHVVMYIWLIVRLLVRIRNTCVFVAVNPLPRRNTVFLGLQLSVYPLVGISIRHCGWRFHILWPGLCNCVSDSELICKAFAEKA